MKKQALLPYLAGGLMSLIFGLSFLAAKIAMTLMGVIGMLAWRLTIAAAAMLILRLAHVIRIDFKGKAWWKLLGIALIYPTGGFLMESRGIMLSSASQAGVMVSMIPIVTMVLGAVILKERTTFLQKIMVILSVGGVLVTTAFSGASAGSSSTAGILFLLGCVVCGSVQAILVHKTAGEFSSIEVTFFMCVTGAAVFDLIALFTYRDDLYRRLIVPALEVKGLFVVLYLGLLCSIVACFCMNYLSAKLPVARASVFTNLATVISVIAGVWLGSETLKLYQFIGMVLILAGVWGANKFVNAENAVSSTQEDCPSIT